MKLIFGLVLVGTLIGINEQLTSEQKLKAENFQLKVQLAQCTTSLNNGSLTVEQQKLISEFREKLKAGPDDEFDWSTLTFKKKESK
jgi:hypothetical protein